MASLMANGLSDEHSLSTIDISLSRSAIGDFSLLNSQLHSPDAQSIACGKGGPLDAFVVDERSVGALQIQNFEVFGACG